ncbi:hypothetical protein [Actinokineospora iranica]|uniref:Uncharacterized protein n=1 Tax=Actinokineospora iranica TaxID=1271860 RepID=A0A1G6Y922_9PSEU|nr:hypothetical protein [Actinokineospora iranica]SDD86898.1 hypothetical protein SAMN05216174_12096 [Actinokineospora iranica]
MTRTRTVAAALALALVTLAARGWVRLGRVEAELRAADHELAHRD